MTGALTILLATTLSYFEAYPQESQAALDFAIEHRKEIVELRKYISQEDASLAMCVVAPEVSRYSRVSDKAETFALYTLYVQGQVSNFSIGAFQMKPSFAVCVEGEVAKHDYLSKYRSLIINKPSERESRYERVERLASLKWQIVYLAAFVDIVKKRTESKSFATVEEKLKYWATLYNVGINASERKVSYYYDRNSFPSFSPNSYNYGDVCLEFYHNSDYCPFLKK